MKTNNSNAIIRFEWIVLNVFHRLHGHFTLLDIRKNSPVDLYFSILDAVAVHVLVQYAHTYITLQMYVYLV